VSLFDRAPIRELAYFRPASCLYLPVAIGMAATSPLLLPLTSHYNDIGKKTAFTPCLGLLDAQFLFFGEKVINASTVQRLE
jgi:hypothetical protein